MRKVFIEEYVKHREMENAEVQNLLYCIAKYNIRTNFYERFAIILDENLTHAVFFHAACWHSYGPKQAHTALMLQKKTLLGENTYDILTRAGPKTVPKKVSKKLVWAPLLSELLYDIRTLGSFVHIFWRCKKMPLLTENTYDILTRAGPETLPKKL